jgi:hypothetical protein
MGHPHHHQITKLSHSINAMGHPVLSCHWLLHDKQGLTQWQEAQAAMLSIRHPHTGSDPISS